MSGGGNVFSRWSRRKLAARQAGFDGESPPGAEPARHSEPGDPAEAEPVETERAGTDRVEAEPAEADLIEAGAQEPLPRLEELVADSDLSPFLRKGVPAALKNSALRKMWSLDPAIRDFVGPAEYAWDFNTPGSMPGFGPLAAGSQVVNFLSTATRSVLAGREDGSETAEPAAEVQEAEPDADDLSGGQAGAAPEGTAADDPASRETAPPPEQTRHAEAVATEKPASAESSPGPARPRHGGALPR